MTKENRGKVVVYEYNSKDETETQYEPVKVCSLTTNSDKTIRLRFGDGNIATNGLNRTEDNIYVKYIICDGSDANTNGTTGSEIKFDNTFYVSCKGHAPIDITNNIKIIFNSDILGGVDFEDQQSIKNNAPLYFSANNRLVTKNDFISYFKGLTTPIKVQNAIAWGQDEIENFEKGRKDNIQVFTECHSLLYSR